MDNRDDTCPAALLASGLREAIRTNPGKGHVMVPLAIVGDVVKCLDEKDQCQDLAKVIADQAGQIADLKRVLMPVNIGAITAKAPEDRDDFETLAVLLFSQDQAKRASRFVADLGTMTEIECEFLDGREIRELARLLAIGEEVCVPRLYGEEDRKRAVDALIDAGIGSSHGDLAPEAVDVVAEALGLRRAN